MEKPLCPFRIGKSAGNPTNCVGATCAFWVKDECAFVKIAKAMCMNMNAK